MKSEADGMNDGKDLELARKMGHVGGFSLCAVQLRVILHFM